MNTEHRYYDAPVNVLAREAAKVFGGTVERFSEEQECVEHWAVVSVDAFADVPAFRLTFDMRGYGVKKNQVEVRILNQHPNRDIYTGGIDYPRASVNGLRDVQAIMADISKRVVNAPGARIALKEYEDRRAKLEASKRGIADHLARLLDCCPNTRTHKNYPPTAHNAQFFSQGGASFEAVLAADGDVTFRGIAPVPLATAIQILALLAKVGQ